MCEYCDGGIKRIERKVDLNVDVSDKKIRIMSYPLGRGYGTCIYIKRKYCHECGRNLKEQSNELNR